MKSVLVDIFFVFYLISLSKDGVKAVHAATLPVLALAIET